MCYNHGTGRGKEDCETEERKRNIAREIIRRQNMGAVLAENGITEEEFVTWLEDGELAAYIYRMAKYSAMARSPEVWQSLKQLADDGDPRGIKLYHDLCERMMPQGSAGFFLNREAEEARRAVFGDGE